MNQLLNSYEENLVVGLKDKAFLVQCDTNGVVELKRSDKQQSILEASESAPSDSKQEDKEQKPQDELDEVHVVATIRNGSKIFCAVARGDKILSLYEMERNSSATSLQPYMIYSTPKRVSCICFTEFLSKNSKSRPVLIVGDLAGDAYAYSLDDQRHRLLLGHTASMLTAMCIADDKILTSDRDEKIRVSSFPQTENIEGFLLGHEAYVTSVDTTPDGLAVTGGGDETIRLWNMTTCALVSELCFAVESISNGSSSQLIPINLSTSDDGQFLAVIFDDSNRLDVYQTATLALVESLKCSAQPLGVSFQSNTVFHVLLRDPDFLAKYSIQDSKVKHEDSKAVAKLKEVATENTIVMPEAILERDQYGQIKLKKLHETRGPSAGEEPWNRSERVQIAKEANKRHKRKRREAKTSA